MHKPDRKGTLRGNVILRALTSKTSAALRADLKLVDLKLGDVLFREHELQDSIYFPITGVVSFICVLRNGNTAEVGLVGREGIVGLSTVLAGVPSAGRALVQAEGQALRMSLDVAQAHMRKSPEFRDAIAKYAALLVAQVMQSVVCARQHELQQQLARWILEMTDRTETDELHMTQDLIATMLGCRREGVSVNATTLRLSGSIAYSRGHLRILDRRLLKAQACECYQTIVNETNRFLRDEHSNAKAV